jgi:hypothetical protein
MEAHGVADLDAMSWYPLSDFLNALNDLAANPNVAFNMVAIGMKIGQDVPLPPNMPDPTLPDVLAVWDELYQMLHRNADVGRIIVEKVTDTHYTTAHSVPYPDDMSYGILHAYGKRFLPAGTNFTVFYDEDAPARDYGGTGESTLIHIKWE